MCSITCIRRIFPAPLNNITPRCHGQTIHIITGMRIHTEPTHTRVWNRYDNEGRAHNGFDELTEIRCYQALNRISDMYMNQNKCIVIYVPKNTSGLSSKKSLYYNRGLSHRIYVR